MLLHHREDDEEPIEIQLKVALIELDGRRLMDVTLSKEEGEKVRRVGRRDRAGSPRDREPGRGRGAWLTAAR